MKNLMSMTDFVLAKNKVEEVTRQSYIECWKYAILLKQLLELWMFIPCDEDGNVLEEPERWNDYLEFPESFDGNKEWYEFFAYEQAKERCLFEGFRICKRNENVDCVVIDYLHLMTQYFEKQTIEDLVKYNLQLTSTALKQIGL